MTLALINLAAWLVLAVSLGVIVTVLVRVRRRTPRRLPKDPTAPSTPPRDYISERLKAPR